MVAISDIRRNIASVKNLGSGLVAVFVGGTSGIGLSTAREFARYATAPHIYLIGRNEVQASEIISELRSINDAATVDFIKSDVSLLKNVDVACQELLKKETKVDLLFLSAGILTMKGRTETIEGIDRKLSLHYYSRIRFIQNLLPTLNQAAAASPGSFARVISVLGAGHEGKLVDGDKDLDLQKNYSLSNAANHSITMTSLSMIQLAAANPRISFIHSAPGGVNTNFAREFHPLTKYLFNALFFVLSPFNSVIGLVPLQDCGERHVYLATNPAFAPRGGDKVETLGADGEKGSGAYRLGPATSIVSHSSLLQGYLDSGMGKKVWEHTVEMFKKATGTA
ncbi:hypothetical protein UA08_03299 [Talaromyces atroroseus]|uniref:NAD(P)-binding protein n=1 Tax=Talaromyces atroroseus TaxID=1441469 RepID=A0A225B0R4_TALAT|nr:hypothetical protein UA08_03299 [Talaromyces atroroseus]OKL60856.1 hypothetical protein UA08_03299 [Talaromyces atroroseus]